MGTEDLDQLYTPGTGVQWSDHRSGFLCPLPLRYQQYDRHTTINTNITSRAAGSQPKFRIRVAGKNNKNIGKSLFLKF